MFTQLEEAVPQGQKIILCGNLSARLNALPLSKPAVPKLSLSRDAPFRPRSDTVWAADRRSVSLFSSEWDAPRRKPYGLWLCRLCSQRARQSGRRSRHRWSCRSLLRICGLRAKAITWLLPGLLQSLRV